MTLLRDIQVAAVSSTTPLGDLLRMCKVLAARLKHQPLADWVERELNGYENNTDLPRYRVAEGVLSRGKFFGYGGSSVDNMPLVTSHLPKQARKIVENHYYLQGAAELETFVGREPGDARTVLGVPWPPSIVASFQTTFVHDMSLADAHKVITRAAIVGVLDAIRNRVLTFALEMEAEAPDAGEAPVGQRPLPDEVVTQIFNMTIHGGAVAVGTGAAAEQTVNVVAGDFGSLRRYLSSVGVTGPDVQALEAVVTSAQTASEGHFPKGVSEWVGQMATKAASGAWEIGKQVGTDVLVKAVSQYFGLQ